MSIVPQCASQCAVRAFRVRRTMIHSAPICRSQCATQWFTPEIRRLGRHIDFALKTWFTTVRTTTEGLDFSMVRTFATKLKASVLSVPDFQDKRFYKQYVNAKRVIYRTELLCSAITPQEYFDAWMDCTLYLRELAWDTNRHYTAVEDIFCANFPAVTTFPESTGLNGRIDFDAHTEVQELNETFAELKRQRVE